MSAIAGTLPPRASAQRADPAEQLVAVDVRHADVAHEHVRPLVLDERERLVGGRRGEHLRAAVGEHAPDELARVELVVDHQHPDPGEVGGAAARSGASGAATRARARLARGATASAAG